MPNRILRDWTDSDRVNSLTAEAERFFTRLIMKADDFGRYHADPKRLKAFLFPLNDDLRETDISRWLAECEQAGLMRFYEVSGKRYLELWNFGQRLAGAIQEISGASKTRAGCWRSQSRNVCFL